MEWKCPICGEENAPDINHCTCGYTLANSDHSIRNKSKTSQSWVIGALILITGLAGVLWSLSLDTSGGTVLGEKINNLGLLNDKNNYLHISIAVSVVGLVFLIMSSFEGGNEDDQDNVNCPFCAETIKKEAVFCRHCKKDLI